MEKENKVKFMTTSEWLEMLAYILAIGMAGFILNIAYTAAYVPAELAAFVLIISLIYFFKRHLRESKESRFYRWWLIQENASEREIKMSSWRFLKKLDKDRRKGRI